LCRSLLNQDLKRYKMKRRFLSGLAVVCMVSLITVSVVSCDGGDSGTTDNSMFDIRSPYENVNWVTFGQYRASLHTHTHNSDGSASLPDSVRRHYELGYDILAITDHIWSRDGQGAADGQADLYLDLVLPSWTTTQWPRKPNTTGATVWPSAGNGSIVPLTHITQEQLDAYQSGEALVDGSPRGRGLLMIPHTGEMAPHNNEELNVFFYKYHGDKFQSVPRAPTAWTVGSLRSSILDAQNNGAVFFINHPGRTTTAGRTGSSTPGFRTADALAGVDVTTDPSNPNNMLTWIRKFANYFMEFSSDNLVGLEIFNRRDQDSLHDRVLWDNILTRTMPEGRTVWGYGNDDSHSNNAIYVNYNVFVMPENTTENFRSAMINGHSYIVTTVAVNEGVNRSGFDNSSFITHGITNRPSITSITVDNDADTITIVAENASKIVWISEGRTIHETILEAGATTGTIDLTHEDIDPQVGSYVRANIMGPNGMAVIQPIRTIRN